MSRLPAKISRSASFTAPAHMNVAAHIETAKAGLSLRACAIIGAFIGVLIAIVVL